MFLLLTGIVPAAGTAQQDRSAEGQVCGRVLHAERGEPLANVVVRTAGGDRGVLTRADGGYCLPLAGEARLVAERVGLAPVTREIAVGRGETLQVELRMADRALELPGIEVTARESRGQREGSTVSRIERAAVEHLQAASLGDVLQLLPGQVARNPDLGSAQQSLLRQVPTTVDAARASALGTAVVLDGAPLSNNANLQTDVTILNSAPGALPPFSSVAGRGVDLRAISPDEIESVEVIRGVPSVRHGDMTAGAILVQTRVGARRPEARVRFNPNLLDANVTAGWGDGVRTSGWSLRGTLTGAQEDPRQTLDNFFRGNGAVAWRSPALLNGRFSTDVRLSGSATLDERRRDPDDERYQQERFSRDRSARLAVSGRLHPRAGGRIQLEWTGSATVGEQVGFFQSIVSRGITPTSLAIRDTTVEGIFGPSEYLNQTTVHGRPVNVYARLEAGARGRTGAWLHVPVAGVEWRYDVNLGRGREFDPLAPPRQNFAVGDRPRAFSDIPSLRILSLYAENRLAGSVGGLPVRVQPGLRWDVVNPTSPFGGDFGAVLQPRVAGDAEVAPGLLFHAAYGHTAKAPPLAYLFPGSRFFDLVNLNFYAADPAERLLIMTTRVVEPSNREIRSFTAVKEEAGLTWRRGRTFATTSLFRERTDGVFGWRRQLLSIPVERLGIASLAPGQRPVLLPEPVRVDTFVGAYDAPDATRRIDTRGVEFALDLPEWSPLRTSFSLSGALTRTRSTDDAPTVDTSPFLTTATRQPERAGIYRTVGVLRQQLVTSARLIHRVPEAGLVVSGLVQTVWSDRDRRVAADPYAVAFFTRAGTIVPLTPEEARSEAHAELVRPFSAGFLAEENRPPLWLANVRLSKALPAGLEMSFFVNNVLASRPLYPSRRSDAFEQRNQPLFFGLELVSRLSL
jgi:hypothetical protein